MPKTLGRSFGHLRQTPRVLHQRSSTYSREALLYTTTPCVSTPPTHKLQPEQKCLLYPAVYADIVHMRSPRTCTLLPETGGVGRPDSSHVTRRSSLRRPLLEGPFSGTCSHSPFAR